MRCRRMVEDENGIKQVVWFGSYGVDSQGNSKLAYELDENSPVGEQQVKANFLNDVSALADDLTQKLSVMKGELWHNISFGLPLLEKVKSKAMIDSAVANIVLSQSEVISIIYFNSTIDKKEYICDIKIQTTFGEVEISI